MKTLWIMVNKFNVSKSYKNAIYLLMLMIESGLIGGIIWMIFGRLFLPSVHWLICFLGYPAIFIGLFGGILYLYNHDFA